MKKITYLVPFLFIACSSPKYSYYFDHIKVKPKSEESLQSKKLFLINPQSLVADASSEVEFVSPLPTHEKVNAVSSIPMSATEEKAEKVNKPVSRKEFKTLLKSVIKEKNAVEIPDHTSSRKANSKNAFAIAGFVCSLVAFLLWPLCILGIILSAIGLESEKRKLAIAGLVIGIVVFTLGLIFFGIAISSLGAS